MSISIYFSAKFGQSLFFPHYRGVQQRGLIKVNSVGNKGQRNMEKPVQGRPSHHVHPWCLAAVQSQFPFHHWEQLMLLPAIYSSWLVITLRVLYFPHSKEPCCLERMFVFQAQPPSPAEAVTALVLVGGVLVRKLS